MKQNTTYTLNNTKKPALANKTNYALVSHAFTISGQETEKTLFLQLWSPLGAGAIKEYWTSIVPNYVPKPRHVQTY